MTKTAGIFLGSLLCATAWAQVAAPVLGYLPDGKLIRPVYGIPVAATVGGALDFGQGFRVIAVSPLQSFALVSGADSGAVLIASAQGGAGTIVPVAGAIANPDRIILSPSGSAAVLWFASANLLQIVSGLPGAPSVRSVDARFLNAPLETSQADSVPVLDSPAALAVSDDGQWAAGAWSRGLYAFGPNGEVTRLPLRERPGALQFFANRQDLAVATDFHLYSITNVGGSAAVAPLSTFADSAGLARWSPTALGLTSDNRHMVVAASSGTLLTLDLTSHAEAIVDCGCSPEGVFRMGNSAFRLTSLGSADFELFDTASNEVLFVPLAYAPQTGGQQ